MSKTTQIEQAHERLERHISDAYHGVVQAGGEFDRRREGALPGDRLYNAIMEAFEEFHDVVKGRPIQ